MLKLFKKGLFVNNFRAKELLSLTLLDAILPCEAFLKGF
jgi:hypothetical protein